ncbi:hypothetical protein D3C75_397610 [compost metagenome]
MITFYNSFSYTGHLVFTFGCGILLLVSSYYASRLNKMAGIALAVLGIGIIGMGVNTILVKHNYIDSSSVIRIIPGFVGLTSIPLLSIAGLQMTEGKEELAKLRKTIKVSTFGFMVFILYFIVLYLLIVNK